MDDNFFMDRDEKAAYNQSARITEFLATLLGSYILSINNGEFDKAIKSIDRVLDIISAKVKENEITEADKMIKEIKNQIPIAMKTYINSDNGQVFISNPKVHEEVYDNLKKLFRYVNKLQDKYGYGMVSLDDPRFAIMQR